MTKGWRYGSGRLSMTNNQHAPNRYSKSYLIKDIYVNYPNATHHGWQAIAYCISPPIPPPDPRTQGNRSHFNINSTKNLLYCRKNSVWNSYSRGEKSGHGGGWECSCLTTEHINTNNIQTGGIYYYMNIYCGNIS